MFQLFVFLVLCADVENVLSNILTDVKKEVLVASPATV